MGFSRFSGFPCLSDTYGDEGHMVCTDFLSFLQHANCLRAVGGARICDFGAIPVLDKVMLYHLMVHPTPVLRYMSFLNQGVSKRTSIDDTRTMHPLPHDPLLGDVLKRRPIITSDCWKPKYDHEGYQCRNTKQNAGSKTSTSAPITVICFAFGCNGYE